MEEHRSELVDVLTDLKSQLHKQTSLRFAFVRGLVYGVGTVIGATVLIGVITWALGVFFNDPEEVPLLNELQEYEP